MPLTLNNTNTLTADNIVVGGTNLSDLYATINYVNSNSGGVSQQDVDDSLAPLISKDIAYSNALNSHIASPAGHELTINSTLTEIGVLNGKQIQNFNGINAINADLTANYQTTTQLNANFVSPTTLTTNHYAKSQIDTTLGNYYTSLQVDAGFYTQTYINTNIYTKTEVDALVGAGSNGYTDAQIDSFFIIKRRQIKIYW